MHKRSQSVSESAGKGKIKQTILLIGSTYFLKVSVGDQRDKEKYLSGRISGESYKRKVVNFHSENLGGTYFCLDATWHSRSGESVAALFTFVNVNSGRENLISFSILPAYWGLKRETLEGSRGSAPHKASRAKSSVQTKENQKSCEATCRQLKGKETKSIILWLTQQLLQSWGGKPTPERIRKLEE